MGGLTPVTPACIMRSAEALGVPPLAIIGILSVERGQVGRGTPDPNGTTDYGPMQINSIWFRTLWSRFRLTPRTIENNGCVNIWSGAWILRHEWRANGPKSSVWNAIANYHSRTPWLARGYALQVFHNLSQGVSVPALLNSTNAVVDGY